MCANVHIVLELHANMNTMSEVGQCVCDGKEGLKLGFNLGFEVGSWQWAAGSKSLEFIKGRKTSFQNQQQTHAQKQLKKP